MKQRATLAEGGDPRGKRKRRPDRDGAAEPSSAPRIPLAAYVCSAILAVAAIVATGFLAYGAEYSRAKEVRLRELAAIGSLKAGQIERWRRDFSEMSEIASRSPLLADTVLRMMRADAASGEESAHLAARIRLYVEHNACDEVIIYGLDGSIVASFPAASPGPPDEGFKAVAAEVMVSGAPAFRDIYRRSDGRYSIDVAAPIVDIRGADVGVLVMRRDPDRELYPLLESWPVPCVSAETLLVRREGKNVVFINRLKYDHADPLTLAFPLSRSDLPASAAASGAEGSFEGNDYRGVPVVAELRRIPGSPWYIVAKMDKSEALAEAARRGSIIIAGAFGFFLLALALIGFAASRKKSGLFLALYREERRRAELNAEFSATLFGIGDGVISTDPGGRVRWLNSAAERMTGWKEEEARGRPLREVFDIRSEDSGLEHPDLVAAVVRTGESIGLASRAVLAGRGGSAIPIADSAAPIRDGDGSIEGVVIVFKDVSAEREAEERSGRLSAIIEGSLNEVLAFDARTLRYSYANRAALSNLGYSMEELSSMTPADIKPELTSESLMDLLEPLRSGSSGAVTLATVNRRKDGSTYDVYLSIQALGSGRGLSYVSIGLDFSERTRLEEELKERLVERETLLRELHHRTKNNLQVVSSLLSLEATGLEGGRSRTALRDMERRVAAMALAHELLYKSESLSRIELGPYLRDIAALALEGGDASGSIDLEFESSPVEAAIEIASPLGIVVNELVTNSMKHGFKDRPGGKVRLSVEGGEGGLLRLRYEDDGRGLPPDFDPDRAGHIGLALIRSLVRSQLRGTMSYRGEAGFSCEIEIAAPPGTCRADRP